MFKFDGKEKISILCKIIFPYLDLCRHLIESILDS